jgi:hypothetical protein
MHKRALTVVAISALLGGLQIGSAPVRDERYLACGPPAPKQQNNKCGDCMKCNLLHCFYLYFSVLF